ncbi:MAG: hypothetical protein V3W34_20570 [Phycisphaerae bacterium]
MRLLPILGLWTGSLVAYAVTCGQVDDFQGGTTMGWTEGAISPNPPSNVPDGGPLGAGDAYLLNVSTGGFGPGSRLVMFNQAQWAGNYLATGVTRIEADMANLGTTPLSMRIAIEGNLGQRYSSSTAVVLPADGRWRHVSFELTTADLTIVGGATSIGDVLADVQTMRILSAAAGPSWSGDAIAATLGVDNIAAIVVGDCDTDGNVDLDDYAVFVNCTTDPGGGQPAGCGCANFDCDNDVDLHDYGALQTTYTGP